MVPLGHARCVVSDLHDWGAAHRTPVVTQRILCYKTWFKNVLGSHIRGRYPACLSCCGMRRLKHVLAAPMTTIFDVFCEAVGGDTNKLLSCSGPPHVAELVSKFVIDVSLETYLYLAGIL